MSDSKTEVAQTVSVRNSDSFEFDRRAMTRDEANKHCGKEADDLMNQKLKERAEGRLNEEHGALTIKALAGQHENTLAWLVAADCKCGRKIEALLSEILSGRRKYCNARTCPIAIADREKATPPAERPRAAVKRRGPGKKNRLEDLRAQELEPPSEPPQPAEKTDGYKSIDHVSRNLVLDSETNRLAYHINNDSGTYQAQHRHPADVFCPVCTALTLSPIKQYHPEPVCEPNTSRYLLPLKPFPEEFSWRGALAEEALLLRKTAVAILAGKVDPAELVKRLREQADKLDEIIYAEA